MEAPENQSASRTRSARKRGVLLVNLGSPDAPTVPAVRRYLNEFLMDPEVIDLPWPIRRLLVSLILLTRPKASAEAYASIWQSGEEPGSPLLHQSRAFTNALNARLTKSAESANTDSIPVALAMRYGSPSIKEGMAQLANCDEVFLIAAYPHHADSTRTTTIAAARKALGAHQQLHVMPPFFTAPAYISALASSIREALPATYDHLLFSYHGLPERHLTKADPTNSHCLQAPDCCEATSEAAKTAHPTCYRHQVYATTQAVCAALAISNDKRSVSFQSRLGRTPWLTPYTDHVLAELPGKGIKQLAVVCPAFVADNLETLEEMGIQGREIFMAAGGESFTLIPCMNEHPEWVEVVAGWCEQSDNSQTD